jgi:hypothetical protein
MSRPRVTLVVSARVSTRSCRIESRTPGLVDGDEVRQKVSDSPLRAGRRRVKLVGSDTNDDLLYTAKRMAIEFVNTHARQR